MEEENAFQMPVQLNLKDSESEEEFVAVGRGEERVRRRGGILRLTRNLLKKSKVEEQKTIIGVGFLLPAFQGHEIMHKYMKGKNCRKSRSGG